MALEGMWDRRGGEGPLTTLGFALSSLLPRRFLSFFSRFSLFFFFCSR